MRNKLLRRSAQLISRKKYRVSAVILYVDWLSAFLNEMDDAAKGSQAYSHWLDIQKASRKKSQGRTAGGFARREADQIRSGHQPYRNKGPWRHRLATLLATADKVIEFNKSPQLSLLARSPLFKMSTIRSLPRINRTWRGKLDPVEIDPLRTLGANRF